MKFLLAGASGFLGSALRVRLAEEGHDVVRLVRREPATASEVHWRPDAGEVDLSAFSGVDVVVNLAGAGVADQLLGDMLVLPKRLVAEGFLFEGTDVTSTLRLALGK